MSTFIEDKSSQFGIISHDLNLNNCGLHAVGGHYETIVFAEKKSFDNNFCSSRGTVTDSDRLKFYDTRVQFQKLFSNNHLFRLIIPYFIWQTGVRIAISNQLVEIRPFKILNFHPQNSTFFYIQSTKFNYFWIQSTSTRLSIDSRISIKYIQKESSFALLRWTLFSAHFLRWGRILSLWPRIQL